jgi:hypothetical protein
LEGQHLSEPSRTGQENRRPCNRWRALFDQNQPQQDLPEKSPGRLLADDRLGKEMFHDHQSMHSDLKQPETLQYS